MSTLTRPSAVVLAAFRERNAGELDRVRPALATEHEQLIRADERAAAPFVAAGQYDGDLVAALREVADLADGAGSATFRLRQIALAVTRALEDFGAHRESRKIDRAVEMVREQEMRT